MHQAFSTGSRVPVSLHGLLALAATLMAVVAAASPASAAQLSGNVSVPIDVRELGTIELPRSVLANGEALAAGTYSVHLTIRTASPETTGAQAALERWVEFRQADAVMGQEIATIVPAGEIGDVADSAPPAAGNSRVEVLRGNEYVRIWINQDGTHYLIHLAVG